MKQALKTDQLRNVLSKRSDNKVNVALLIQPRVSKERRRETETREGGSNERCRKRQTGTHGDTQDPRESERDNPRLARPEEKDHTERKQQTYTRRRMERDGPSCHLGSLSAVIGSSLVSWAQLRSAWLQASLLSLCQQQHMGIPFTSRPTILKGLLSWLWEERK